MSRLRLPSAPVGVALALALLAGWVAAGSLRGEAAATDPASATDLGVTFVDSAVIATDDASSATTTGPGAGAGAQAAGVTTSSQTANAAAGRVTVAIGDAAERTGISARALGAYAAAAAAVHSVEAGGCGLHWSQLAAIGSIESGHGTHGGSTLGDDGRPRPAIYGPRLDGTSFIRVPDSDGGAIDGDTEVDRAVGPLQFIPQTWERWGADGDGDGVADPQDLDDASLAAAHYLCASGDLTDPETLHRAVFSYNHDEDYVRLVLGRAADYDRMLGG